MDDLMYGYNTKWTIHMCGYNTKWTTHEWVQYLMDDPMCGYNTKWTTPCVGTILNGRPHVRVQY